MGTRAALAVLALDWFFYRSIWALIPLSLLGAGHYRLLREVLLEEKRRKIRIEFKELLLLSCTGLRAGYSVENALQNSFHDLERLFGRDSAVCEMIEKIEETRRNHGPIREVFIRAGAATGIHEITDFGAVYGIAYERSGNLREVMENAASGLLNRLKLEEEIRESLNERRYEMKIMNLMPFVIMSYISLTSKDYFEKMYGNLPGILIMSAALIVFITAYLWGEKIVRTRI
ncbi:MAG: hypothetical protein K6F53_11505 [Lachnospiraceae bacterium]|nr:hypothetical protein [Lachnospiraceae bacterium]